MNQPSLNKPSLCSISHDLLYKGSGCIYAKFSFLQVDQTTELGNECVDLIFYHSCSVCGVA